MQQRVTHYAPRMGNYQKRVETIFGLSIFHAILLLTTARSVLSCMCYQ
jgi:hypothetical protein